MKSILIIEPESQIGIDIILFLLERKFWITVVVKDENHLGVAHPRLDIVKIDYIVFKKLKAAMEGQNFLILCNNESKVTLSHIENCIDAMAESHLYVLIVVNEKETQTTFEMNKYLKFKEYPKIKVFNITNFKSAFDFSQLLSILENN